MDCPPGYTRLQPPGGAVLVRDDVSELDPEVWWQAGEPLAGAAGRGGVVVLEYRPGARAVARSYRRGGALRHVLPDRFVDSERAERELLVLVALARQGVPVVEPLAAARRGPAGLSQLRLVTVLVEGGEPMPAALERHPERAAEIVAEAGRVVRAAFDAGLVHPDLHPDNLLVTVGEGGVAVRLLDLDRATLHRHLPERERDRMLLRMARYLERHEVASRAVDHLRFLAGMGLDRRARRRELARLRPAYARAVVRHRVSWGRLSARARLGEPLGP